MHTKTRNIVRANALHNTLDVTFGPSDDDFHYQQEHGTITHDERQTDANPLGVKLIFHAHGCEIQWASGDNARSETHLDGYVGLDPNGRLSFPFWTGDQDEQLVPVWVELDGNRLRLYAHEGEPFEGQHHKYLIFDSAKLDAEGADELTYEGRTLRGDMQVAPGSGTGEWIVGITNPAVRIRNFDSHDEASEFIGTLPHHDEGIYYIDGPER